MGILSYAQNFEDVILWRAVGHIQNGCYIDVGAQHPVTDSVSKAFYERGWRGIHVEPSANYANLLRASRPDETVVQAAAASTAGIVRFFEIPGTGLSTARSDIAEEHKDKLKCSIVEELVPATTLDDLLDLTPSNDIHWLKIDVEGYEKEVLSGWRRSSKRPWIVVIEATHPNTQTDTFTHWERLVLRKQYSLAYRDGLNRFYLSDQHRELASLFQLPPNIFDGFQLGPTGTPLTRHLSAEHEKEVAALEAQRADFEAKLNQNRTATQSYKAEADARQQALSALAERTIVDLRRHAESHLKERLELEQAHASRIEAMQRDSYSVEAALRAQFESRTAELQRNSQVRQNHLEQTVAELRQESSRTLLEERSKFDRLVQGFNKSVEAERDQTHRLANKLIEQERAHAERFNVLTLQSQARETVLTANCEERIASLGRDWQDDRSKYEMLLTAERERHQLILAETRTSLEMVRKQSARAMEGARAESDAARESAQARERELYSLVERIQIESHLKRESHLAELLKQEQCHIKHLESVHSATASRENTIRREFAEALGRQQEASRHAKEQLKQLTDTLPALANRISSLIQERISASQEQLTLAIEAVRTETQSHYEGLLNHERSRADHLLAQLSESRAAAIKANDLQVEHTDALRRELQAKQHKLKEHYESREDSLKATSDAILVELRQSWQRERQQLEQTIHLLHEQQDAHESVRAVLQQNNLQLADAITGLKTRLTLMTNSRSWRWTTPFRRFREINSHDQLLVNLYASHDTHSQPNDASLVMKNMNLRSITQTDVHRSMVSESINTPVLPIKHVNDLLRLDGSAFVSAAYLALLGREADPDGFNHYSKLLFNEHGKFDIIDQLTRSKEARAKGLTLIGLKTVLASHKRETHWLWGSLIRNRSIAPQLTHIETQLSLAIAQLHTQQEDAAIRYRTLEAMMTTLFENQQPPQPVPAIVIESDSVPTPPPTVDTFPSVSLGAHAQRWFTLLGRPTPAH